MATDEDGSRTGRRTQASIQGRACALHHLDCQLWWLRGSFEGQALRSAWLWELKGPVLLLLSLALYTLACSVLQSLQEVFRSFRRTAMRRNKCSWPLVSFQTLNAKPQVLLACWANGKEWGLGAHPERPQAPPPSSLNSLPSLIASP